MGKGQPSISKSWWLGWPKRCFDIVVAAVLTLLLSPVLIATAILVKLTSTGPVFFTQSRGGLRGKPFRVIKFRTMRGGRTPDPKELVPLEHADITRIGRWLRRTKIDELPQLFNVVLGNMSLVGPRPTLLDQIEAYDDFRRQRLLVRPGVTGLAQVHTSAATSWEQRILFDIAYVRRCGFRLDLLICLRTLAVVVRGEEADPPRFQNTRYASCIAVPDDYEPVE